MTPEQNEQWQGAILPIADRLTGERWEAEKTLIALLPKEERFGRISQLCGYRKLKEMGIDMDLLHDALLGWGGKQHFKPWFSQFALRSACAIVGIQLAHTEKRTYYALYKRMYIRFVRESLLPFVECLGQMPPGDIRNDYYTSLMALYEACDEFCYPADPEPWRKVNSILSMCTEVEAESEKGQCLDLVKVLFNSILSSINLQHLMVRDDVPRPVTYEIQLLNRQFQWLFTGRASDTFDSGDYTHLVATAYLTALEAECPPPDWLPAAYATRSPSSPKKEAAG